MAYYFVGSCYTQVYNHVILVADRTTCRHLHQIYLTLLLFAAFNNHYLTLYRYVIFIPDDISLCHFAISTLGTFLARKNSKMAAATTTAAADPATVIAQTKQDPRVTRGVELLKDKRYEEAITVFEDVLKTMCVAIAVFPGVVCFFVLLHSPTFAHENRVETEKESDSLALAPVYYEYGNSMLKLAEVCLLFFRPFFLLNSCIDYHFPVCA